MDNCSSAHCERNRELRNLENKIIAYYSGDTILVISCGIRKTFISCAECN